MKTGIETHRWGFFRKEDNKLIASCIAITYYESITHFEDIGLMLNDLYEIKIIE